MNRHQRRAAAKQGKPSGSPSVQAKNELAIRFAQQGRLEEALGLFREAVKLEPKNTEAHNNLGLSLHQMGRLDEAIPHYQRALALNSDNVQAHNNLANALKDLGRLDEAVLHYRRAIVLGPGHAEPHYNLGLALAEQRKLDDAISAYNTALSLRPDYLEVRISLGSALADLARSDEAAVAATQAGAIITPAASPHAHYLLGALLARCGLKEGAQKHLQHYLRQDARDRWGARMLLAGLGVERMPERASDAMIDRVYAKRAITWDRAVAAGANTYRGDVLVAQALEKSVGAGAALDILDAGCGTGLVGTRIKHLARRLDGVDLSAMMLAQAKQKSLYDTLHQGDLMSFMTSHPRHYDAVACAATLIHFGELRAPFEAAAACLRDGGRFVFTLFPNPDDDRVTIHPISGLAEGGCYAHGRRYIASVAEAADFAVESLKDEVHEYYAGKPEIGIVGVLRRK